MTGTIITANRHGIREGDVINMLDSQWRAGRVTPEGVYWQSLYGGVMGDIEPSPWAWDRVNSRMDGDDPYGPRWTFHTRAADTPSVPVPVVPTVPALPSEGDYVVVTDIPMVASNAAEIRRVLAGVQNDEGLYRVHRVNEDRARVYFTANDGSVYYAHWEWPVRTASGTLRKWKVGTRFLLTGAGAECKITGEVEGRTPVRYWVGNDATPQISTHSPEELDSNFAGGGWTVIDENAINPGAVFKANNDSTVIIVPSEPGDAEGQIRMLAFDRRGTSMGPSYVDSLRYMLPQIQSGRWVRVTDNAVPAAIVTWAMDKIKILTEESASRAAQLRTRQSSDANVRAFQTEIFTALREEAERRDWCTDYERFIASHGWEDIAETVRESEFDVSVDVRIIDTRTVRIRARSADDIDAEMIAEELGIDEEDIDSYDVD